MNIKILQSIADITASEWNTLFDTSNPFIQHAFLLALEQSGCTQPSTGWEPQHLVVYQDNDIVAALPNFLKTHSYGEYVFDWAWANAYQQNGLSYYPKLVSAIPYTPSTGPRIGFGKNTNTQEKRLIIKRISQTLGDQFSHADLSSWHLLFPEHALSTLLQQAHWKQRVGLQYHWYNDQYASFDDFLSTFKSRKRKTLRKERQAIIDQGITMERVQGNDISKELMTQFYRFYHLTYLKRSGQHGYLNLKFFLILLDTMSENLVMMCAKKNQSLVGAALCFKDEKTLYGRYWGCEQEYEFLHFETCYYQGIEYCIRHRLDCFDPGAQGEHKISRGFKPTKTFSNHLILHPDFRRAIHHFIDEEEIQINAHLTHLNTLLPFKSESS